MSIARVTEIIAASDKSFEDAVADGIRRATKTLKNVKSAWVQDQQAVIKNDEIKEFRVTLKVTFILEE